MGVSVWLLDSASFLAGVDTKLTLLVSMGAGALIYGGAALALGAMTRGELTYMFGSFWRRIQRRLAKA
jgi:hypothetical protein